MPTPFSGWHILFTWRKSKFIVAMSRLIPHQPWWDRSEGCLARLWGAILRVAKTQGSHCKWRFKVFLSRPSFFCSSWGDMKCLSTRAKSLSLSLCDDVDAHGYLKNKPAWSLGSIAPPPIFLGMAWCFFRGLTRLCCLWGEPTCKGGQRDVFILP